MPGVSIACHRAECAHRDPSGTSLGPQYAALLRHPALRRRRGSPDVRVDERARLALQRRHLRKEQSRDEEPATGKLDGARFSLVADARDTQTAVLEKRLEAAVQLVCAVKLCSDLVSLERPCRERSG